MTARVGLGAFLDFVCSRSQDSVRMVRRQRLMYLDHNSKAWLFYQPFRAGIRRAVSSPDTGHVISEVVTNANRYQLPHFRELEDGFRRWHQRSRPVGLPVDSYSWQWDELEVRISNQTVFGLRYPDGTAELVLPYFKEPELTSQDTAPVLRILERSRNEVLPGATPMVLDVRRGKPIRLRTNTNRNDLDIGIAGEVSKYLTHWQASEAA
ncbi:hypothetical protein SAMN04487820_103283 [Actinopolyspora mzabensis]|uniref:Uncharacterized protein n=1 Tax=Actinopolyspora mzabensis TaxID=995066 RepID=A0A1G8Y6L8_ACTMZ|nr:hypothetical protein [Actinopolyspora mzabensis]SDJ98452.1 hypothetical protein SAMN04487820_103283 [Actinopolyspora mzabensis]